MNSRPSRAAVSYRCTAHRSAVGGGALVAPFPISLVKGILFIRALKGAYMETQKKITLVGGIAMGIGAIIGTGIFGSLPEVINDVGTATIFALIGATIQIILLSISAMYVNSVIQSSSIKFMTMTKIMHPCVGYLQTLLAFLLPLLVSLYGILFGNYFLILFPNCPLTNVAISIILILVFTVMAWFGNHSVSLVNDIFVVILLLTIFMFCIGGVPHINRSAIKFTNILGSGVTLTSMGAAIGVLSSALNGAGSLAEISDDIENPSKNVPKILILSPCIVCILYMAMAIITLGCMPNESLESLAEVAQEFFSPTLVTIFVVGGPIAGIITSLLPVALVPVSIMEYGAKLKILPEAIGKKNKHGVPWPCLLISSSITIAILATGATFGPVMTAFSFSNTIFALPYYIMPLFLEKRYPNACKYSSVRIPKIVINGVSVIALVYSCYIAFGLIASLNTIVWIIFILILLVGYIYLFARIGYLKRKGIDLMEELKMPYAPWEEREKELASLNKKVGDKYEN